MEMLTINIEIYDDTSISDFEQAMLEGIDEIDCSYEIIDNTHNASLETEEEKEL